MSNEKIDILVRLPALCNAVTRWCQKAMYNHIFPAAKMVIFNNIFSTHNLSFCWRLLAIANQLLLSLHQKKPASILEVALAIFYWRARMRDTPLERRHQRHVYISNKNVNQFHSNESSGGKERNHRIKFLRIYNEVKGGKGVGPGGP